MREPDGDARYYKRYCCGKCGADLLDEIMDRLNDQEYRLAPYRAIPPIEGMRIVTLILSALFRYAVSAEIGPKRCQRKWESAFLLPWRRRLPPRIQTCALQAMLYVFWRRQLIAGASGAAFSHAVTAGWGASSDEVLRAKAIRAAGGD